MLPFSGPVTEIIKRRYSCRTYAKTPIGPSRPDGWECYASRSRTALWIRLPFRVGRRHGTRPESTAGIGNLRSHQRPGRFHHRRGRPGREEPGRFRLRDGGRYPLRNRPRSGDLLAGRQLHQAQLLQEDQGHPRRDRTGRGGYRLRHRAGRARDLLRRQAKSDTRLPWEALFFLRLREPPSARAPPPPSRRSAGHIPSRWKCCAWRRPPAITSPGELFRMATVFTSIFSAPGVTGQAARRSFYSASPTCSVWTSGSRCATSNWRPGSCGLEGKWEVREPALHKTGRHDGICRDLDREVGLKCLISSAAAAA